ncbi:hypothetical protein PCASD_20432 [Puccinia coronata f. sp. avenae]|uniref:Uncharacterized protein n=1 Tax=Puccinia coronata f. sp. avenae TaxID=200324 RepID=A0A2N5TQW0_9BASI|nr:hypothetical protein PCASD_20432 [Puccinia coronata f. sp. avenae]
MSTCLMSSTAGTLILPWLYTNPLSVVIPFGGLPPSMLCLSVVMRPSNGDAFRIISSNSILSSAQTAMFDRWLDRHCPTKAPSGKSDRPVQAVPGTSRTGPAGTGWTNLSN